MSIYLLDEWTNADFFVDLFLLDSYFLFLISLVDLKLAVDKKSLAP